MTTIFDGLAAIVEKLPRAARGFATGGGDLSLSDTDLLTIFEDDTFNGGACLIETGDLAGAVLTITDFDATSGTLTLSERIWNRSGAETPAAGDVYLATTRLYAPGQLLLALREALRAWGQAEEMVSLGTGDGETTAFDLPSGTSGDVVRVYTTTEDGDERSELWWWEQTDTGIELTNAPSENYTITAVVRDAAANTLLLPPSETTLDDEIPESVPAEFLGYFGAFACLRAAVGVPGQDQDQAVKLMNYYAEQAEATRERSQVRAPRARERFLR